MKAMRVFAMMMLLALVAAGIYAQGDTGQQQTEQGRHPRMEQMRERMKARGEEMKQKHQQMMEKMKEMDAALQQKIDAMNAATGDQKVTAIADVLNEMFNQRKAMHEQMATMHDEMCKHMMMMDHGMRGGMMHDMETTGTTER